MMLDEMRAFVLVAETGSVQAAAHAIPLTQPAVTRQLQRLERTLGAPLLDRRTKPARLTAAGELALPRCRAILAGVDELRVACGGLGELHGVLRLGVSDGLSGHVIANVIEEFGHGYPHVALRVVGGASGELLAYVARGTIDAALVLTRPGTAAPIGAREVGAEPLRLVVPHGVKVPRRATLRAANEVAAWIVSPDDTCDVRRTLEAELARQAIPLRVAAEVQDIELQLSLIQRGAGIGLVPQRRLRREAVHRHRVRVVPVTPSLDLPILFVPAPRLGVLGRAADALADLLGIWLTADGTPGGNRAEAAGQVGGGLSPAVLQRQRIRATRAAD